MHTLATFNAPSPVMRRRAPGPRSSQWMGPAKPQTGPVRLGLAYGDGENFDPDDMVTTIATPGSPVPDGAQSMFGGIMDWFGTPQGQNLTNSAIQLATNAGQNAAGVPLTLPAGVRVVPKPGSLGATLGSIPTVAWIAGAALGAYLLIKKR